MQSTTTTSKLNFFFPKRPFYGQPQQHISVISALGIWRQKDPKFEFHRTITTKSPFPPLSVIPTVARLSNTQNWEIAALVSQDCSKD